MCIYFILGKPSPQMLSWWNSTIIEKTLWPGVALYLQIGLSGIPSFKIFSLDGPYFVEGGNISTQPKPGSNANQASANQTRANMALRSWSPTPSPLKNGSFSSLIYKVPHKNNPRRDSQIHKLVNLYYSTNLHLFILSSIEPSQPLEQETSKSFWIPLFEVFLLCH